jgi:hypothetical protein
MTRPAHTDVTFGEAVDAFLSSSRCVSANTARAYTAVLDRTVAVLDVDVGLAGVTGDAPDLADPMARRGWGHLTVASTEPRLTTAITPRA